MGKKTDFGKIVSAEHAIAVFRRNKLVFKPDQAREILLFMAKIAKLVVEENEKQQ